MFFKLSHQTPVNDYYAKKDIPAYLFSYFVVVHALGTTINDTCEHYQDR